MSGTPKLLKRPLKSLYRFVRRHANLFVSTGPQINATFRVAMHTPASAVGKKKPSGQSSGTQANARLIAMSSRKGAQSVEIAWTSTSAKRASTSVIVGATVAGVAVAKGGAISSSKQTGHCRGGTETASPRPRRIASRRNPSSLNSQI